MNRVLRFNKLIIMLVFCFILCSCESLLNSNVPEGYTKLPSLNGLAREQITNIFNDLELKWCFYFYNDEPTVIYDTFVKYGNGHTANEVVSNDTFIRIYTTPLELTYKRSGEVHIDFDYIGKSFINDGVGKVTLARCIDGDTFHVYDITGEYIKIRFLGIDTPESTREHDPWGSAASAYCKKRIQSAKEIVLESEGSRKDLYDRYLAFVWLDGELYNLQCIEEAYSNSTLGSKSKYYEYFSDVDLHVSLTGRRFFGEYDPDYNYN